jgi:2'-5' RNA ligase
MSFLRSFIAIDLPAELKQVIGEYQASLKTIAETIRWEEPKNLHLTLFFLGKLKDEELHQVNQVLLSKLHEKPFRLQPAGLSYLYKKHEDSLIYIDVAGDSTAVQHLQNEVSRLIKISIDMTLPHRFLPHMTIGRLKPFVNPPEKKLILRSIFSQQPGKFPAFTVTEIKIMQTVFSSDKSHRYITHFKLPLDTTPNT